MHRFFSTNTDTCQPALLYKIKTLHERTDLLPTEFSVPIHAWFFDWMEGHSLCSPPLLTTPTQRPATLDPPAYSGSTHTVHTASNDPLFTRHEPSIASVLPYTPRRAYLTQFLFSASQHSVCSLTTFPSPNPLTILLYTGHLTVPHST